MTTFDPVILTWEDHKLALSLVGDRILEPDLVIAPDGQAYLYRWHILRDKKAASVYFHIQVKSDPERPLHDHPWDNTSVILSGGYNELYEPAPDLIPPYDPAEKPYVECLYRAPRKGSVVFRPAKTAHRLILPTSIPYTMSLFTTGPVIREWGFWYPDGFRPHWRHVQDRDGVSVHVSS